jgi:hypothetical protein
MSFDESLKEIRLAITAAIIASGFQPIIIDEAHLPSDKTIPDEILSAIKKI